MCGDRGEVLRVALGHLLVFCTMFIVADDFLVTAAEHSFLLCKFWARGRGARGAGQSSSVHYGASHHVWGMTGGGVGKKLGAPGSITLTPRAFSLKDLRCQEVKILDGRGGGQ
eukprot:scaffold63847_cov15-Tisochrysis_lutea.AAC.1